jgi:pimeloyl-ACP methyl ester carboxylesterase
MTPDPKPHATGRPRLARDGQQWAFDLAVKDNGRVMHFQPDGRGGLPRAVKSHAMISKHVGRVAQRLERLGDEELAAGHPETALGLYFDAAVSFVHAQHPVFSINEEKRLLHASALRCYDQVRRLAPYPIEHLDIGWDEEVPPAAGNLHLCPGEGARPCVFFIPGWDVAKEMFPHPQANIAHQRGLHVFSFDGPGQGESNLRGIALESANYERAASAAITQLLARPEISDVVVFGQSFGSFWAVRTAALDDRVRALAAPWMSGCDRYYLMTEESPRFKQLFAHLSRAESEEEVDALMAQMTNHGDMAKIRCPTLLAVGEYDPRSPLDEVYELYDELTAPKEMWVFADQHHPLALAGAPDVGNQDTIRMSFDWLRDRLNDVPLRHNGDVVYVEPGGGSPNGSAVHGKRHWYQAPSL